MQVASCGEKPSSWHLRLNMACPRGQPCTKGISLTMLSDSCSPVPPAEGVLFGGPQRISHVRSCMTFVWVPTFFGWCWPVTLFYPLLRGKAIRQRPGNSLWGNICVRIKEHPPQFLAGTMWCWEQGEGSQSNARPPSQSLTFKPFPPRERGPQIWDRDPSRFETKCEKEDREALK